MAKRDQDTTVGGNGQHSEAERVRAESGQPSPATPVAAERPATARPAPAKARRNFVRPVVLVALLGAGAYFGGRFAHDWWTEGRFMVETDDAYVAADITTLAAKESGYITEVLVKDNQSVKAGDVIARIDAGDYQLALDQARGNLSGNQASVDRIARQIEAGQTQVVQARAGVDSANANLRAAETTYTRQAQLVQTKVSAPSQLDDATAARDAARAAVEQATAAVSVAEANVAVLEAQKVEMEHTGAVLKTAVDIAERNLSFTDIRSPVDGVLGNTAFKLGTYVTPGQQLGSLVALGTVHIDANYKETQLAGIRPGERVRITVDALGGSDVFEGTVESLSPATGAVFSLLPPNNATGNFTKIVQRLPVRVALPPEAIASGKLRPGLSVVVAADRRTIAAN